MSSFGFAASGLCGAEVAAGQNGFDPSDLHRPNSFGTHSFTTAFLVIDKGTALATGWRGTLANAPVIVLLMLAGIGIFACGAAVVLLMLVYLLLFKIGCIVVFCLLPFGAFEKTAWVVERPIGWVMSNGIRFLVLALVVGLFFRFADQATAQTLNVADGTWTDLGNATAVALQLLLVNLLHARVHRDGEPLRRRDRRRGGEPEPGDFTNRVAGGGTSEPIVRAAGGATNSAMRHAAVGTGLGVIAAGAAIGAVWSKSKQKVNIGRRRRRQ